MDGDMSYRICIIGAGFSGIGAGIQLQRKLGMRDNFVIYEEREDLGGVWQTNTYPGCAADVPSPYYCFSFAPSSDWSAFFAPQTEIHGYLKKVASDYGLHKFLRFHHKVTSLFWDEDGQVWRVTVLDKSVGKEAVEEFDIVISCVGVLRVPNIPAVFQGFQGPFMHSAEWDHSVDIQGKTVAVVGNGSSAAQIIPAIVDRVSQLIVYQRNPTWFFPKPEFSYPAWLKKVTRWVPGLQKTVRVGSFLAIEVGLFSGLADGFVQRIGAAVGRAWMWLGVRGDAELVAKCTPKQRFFCKAPSLSNDFYSALRKRHVEVVSSHVVTAEGTSILSEDGKERKADVLILATGFRVQDYFAPLVIKGLGGVDLLSLWKTEGPSAYMGMASHVAPNFFVVAGPNGTPGHIILVIELQLRYIMRLLRRMRESRAQVAVVKEDVEKAYIDKMLKAHGSTVVGAEGCDSWFRDARGVVTGLSPYSCTTRWAQMRRVRGEEDYHFC